MALAEKDIVEGQIGGGEVLPLRRSSSMPHSIALNTKANGVPLEQVVSIWSHRGGDFINAILDAPANNGLSATEKEQLRLQAAKAMAHNWIESQGYTARTDTMDDRIFYHWSLFE